MKQMFFVVRDQVSIERIHEVAATDVLIGRGENCGLRLSSDSVSRRHALFVWKDSAGYIQDLGSRNGTRVNGNDILDSTAIDDGDEIQIGPFRLKACLSFDAAIAESADSDISTQSHEGNPSTYRNQLSQLTPAQLRVYYLFLDGLIEKEIGARLGITVNTVHAHAKAIYKTLSVSTRGELIAQWASDVESRKR